MSELRNILVWFVVAGVAGCGVEGEVAGGDPGDLARINTRDCSPAPVGCEPECGLAVDLEGDEDVCICPGEGGGVFGREIVLEDPTCDDAHPVRVVQPGEDDCVPDGCVVSDA